jgi:hypothetical protein
MWMEAGEMTRLLVLAALSLVLSLVTFGADATPVLGNASNNLRAIWHMDAVTPGGTPALSITSDASGNANNGTLRRGAVQAPGKFGQGLRFDGVGDFVEVPHHPSLDITGPLTLEAWIKAVDFAQRPRQADGNIYILSKDSARNRSYGLGISTVDAPAPSGCPAPGPNAFMIVFTTGGIAMACSSMPLTMGEFHHLAGTYNPTNGRARIFVDGMLAGTANVPRGSWIRSGTASVQIGARDFRDSRGFFHGTIDEARIWSRVLNANEIGMSADMGLQVEGAGTATGPIPTRGIAVPDVIGQGLGFAPAVYTSQWDIRGPNTTGPVRVNFWVLTERRATTLIDPDGDKNFAEHITVTRLRNATLDCNPPRACSPGQSALTIDFDDNGVAEGKGVQFNVRRIDPTQQARVEFQAHLTDGQVLNGEIRIRR